MFRRTSHDRAILVVALPAFGALIAEPIYVLTDTAIVGHISTEALAGLAVAAAILLTVFSMLIFLAYGTTGIVGRLLGSGQRREAAVQGVQAVWLAIFSGAVVTVGIAFFSGALVDLFEPSALVRKDALTYLRISLVGLVGQLIVMSGTGYLRGLQDTRTPLMVALAGALINLGLELVLVFIFDLGIAGSAWSTVFAQWLCALAYLVVISRA
ncbi:MAG: MATE family efflux transporter, partial [Acidimicrobiales bacterium]|nr:MATE family efflux transporter [Acidimicrobiales bacterium]